MKVLVTGGTGYLGSAIARALVAHGHHPVVFARSASRSAADGACGAMAQGSGAGCAAEAFDGDVRDLGALRAAARGCDAICHTAALVSLWRRRRQEFDEINVGGLDNVLRVAAETRPRRIAYTSSFLALPPTGASAPQGWNDYQRTKVLAAEHAARAAEAGAPLIRLYPGVIYGPGPATEGNLIGRQIADHLRGRLPGIIGAGRCWSFAWVDDVADAHVVALERGEPGARYHLGGENARQMRVFEIVRDLTGRPLPRRIPASIAVLLGVAEELRAAVSRRPPLLTAGTVEILNRDWMLPSDVAARDLGYRVTPLETGIRRVVARLAEEWARGAGPPSTGTA